MLPSIRPIRRAQFWRGIILLIIGASLCGLYFDSFFTIAGADLDGEKSLATTGKSNRLSPKHDPIDQPFRRAPMSAASRSIVISVATNLHLAFDVKLLGTHTAWSGQSLNLLGPPYTGQKTPFVCNYDGVTLWTMPPFFPWSIGELPQVDLRETTAGSDFKGISTKVRATALLYELSVGQGKTVRIHEIPGHQTIDGVDVIVRRWEIAACEQTLWLLAHAEMGRVVKLSTLNTAAVIQREKDWLLAVVRGSGNPEWKTVEREVDYQIEVITDEGTEKGNPKTRVAGQQARAYLKIPPHSTEIAVEIASVVCPESKRAEQMIPVLSQTLVRPAQMAFLTSNEKNPQAPMPKVVTSDKSFNKAASGDAFYRIEHFPVPKEIDLLVGGMDWLSNGDLAVCTWPGEVYIVQNLQGPPAAATYRRFARGLNEPLGLKVVRDQIYVVQKSELTRLTDTDGNGEADLYESINDDWGYTGNYHAYAFGPVIDSEKNFYTFLCGQRGRWDVPYVGWCVKISADGKTSEGFCSGLRVPNGVGTFGPDGDIFITDNQGNWIGACKLNHLQRGKFYGFPSGYPAPAEEYEKKRDFQLPALWFPRKLAPSTSGIENIADERFGPFKGQMLVGDFQNAVVMRVALEKINGQWQGAVWPFAKGFLSGVNRLTMGPDGKLYVGGCKRAWSNATPQEYSLDRVSFTGAVPFEIKEAHAQSDGFELIFTEPVAKESAADSQNYYVSQFTYEYHAAYGSPEIDHDGKENSATEIKVAQATVSGDGLKVHLKLEGWKAGYVTAVRALDLKSNEGSKLWHDTFYYTLNHIPK